MINPLVPGPHWRTEQTIRVPYRLEQHEEEQKQEEAALPLERPLQHDPYWNRRFWSVQHVNDCITGKTFHWFWSPMSEVFSLAQLMFLILPVAVYMNDRGTNLSFRGLILLAVSTQLLASLSKFLWVWYNNWRFSRTPYRIIRH